MSVRKLIYLFDHLRNFLHKFSYMPNTYPHLISQKHKDASIVHLFLGRHHKPMYRLQNVWQFPQSRRHAGLGKLQHRVLLVLVRIVYIHLEELVQSLHLTDVAIQIPQAVIEPALHRKLQQQLRQDRVSLVFHPFLVLADLLGDMVHLLEQLALHHFHEHQVLAGYLVTGMVRNDYIPGLHRLHHDLAAQPDYVEYVV